MVKVVSKVSKTLANRRVLMAPGGKGELHKHVRGVIHPTDTPETRAADRKALKWIKVNASAYISASLRL